jgi:peptidyl-tRNA hydrolase, PTH1 family
MAIRVIVGLGNPGAAYSATRHNLGFRAMDRLAADVGAGGFASRGPSLAAEWRWRGAKEEETVLLVKPQTWMNRSGEAVARLREELGEALAPDRLLVAADDVNLPLGRLRFRPDGSCGGHNGLASIEAALGSQEYPRLRIGVGPPEESGAFPGEALTDYVLGAFTEAEETMLAEVVAAAARGMRDWIEKGLTYCQDHYNGWRIERA